MEVAGYILTHQELAALFAVIFIIVSLTFSLIRTKRVKVIGLMIAGMAGAGNVSCLKFMQTGFNGGCIEKAIEDKEIATGQNMAKTMDNPISSIVEQGNEIASHVKMSSINTTIAGESLVMAGIIGIIISFYILFNTIPKKE